MYALDKVPMNEKPVIPWEKERPKADELSQAAVLLYPFVLIIWGIMSGRVESDKRVGIGIISNV